MSILQIAYYLIDVLIHSLVYIRIVILMLHDDVENISVSNNFIFPYSLHINRFLLVVMKRAKECKRNVGYVLTKVYRVQGYVVSLFLTISYESKVNVFQIIFVTEHFNNNIDISIYLGVQEFLLASKIDTSV